MVEQSCGPHSNTSDVNPPQRSSNQDSINLNKIRASQMTKTYHQMHEHILSTQYVQMQLVHIIKHT